jgi:hypothetical protein
LSSTCGSCGFVQLFNGFQKEDRVAQKRPREEEKIDSQKKLKTDQNRGPANSTQSKSARTNTATRANTKQPANKQTGKGTAMRGRKGLSVAKMLQRQEETKKTQEFTFMDVFKAR